MKPGDYLYASCSAVLFGRVLAVADGKCTVVLFDPSELDDEGDKYVGPNPLTVAIEGVSQATVANVDERGSWTGEYVTLDTPGDGCFRCTKLFSVLDAVNLDAPFWDSMSPNTIGAARAQAGA